MAKKNKEKPCSTCLKLIFRVISGTRFTTILLRSLIESSINLLVFRKIYHHNIKGKKQNFAAIFYNVIHIFFSRSEVPPPLPEPNPVLSPSQDPQRDAARAKREHRRERDREHHRDSRGGSGGGGGKSSNTRRSDRESSVPHSEQEYAISTKHQQQQPQQHRQGQNRSRERPRQHSRSQENERPLSHHEQMTATDLNLEPCKLLNIFCDTLQK